MAIKEFDGNSNQITRDYLDSLLIETRYIDSDNPDTHFTLYGKEFDSPIMTAALSHLGAEGGPALAKGAKDANAAFWYGLAPQEEIDSLSQIYPGMIEIIKPYADRDLIYQKIEHAQEMGHLAVGIDIDHPFGPDGGPDICDGYEMTTLTSHELREFCSFSKLPLIVKGVLSLRDADRALAAGVGGMLLSHHNNRIAYAVPALMILPEIAALVNGSVPIFVDGMIQTGMDAFKALALGASAVGIGRPLMAAAKKDPEHGVASYLAQVKAELGKAMAFAGCPDLSRMDPTVIRHRVGF